LDSKILAQSNKWDNALRREIHFDKLSDVAAECQRLQKSGYTKNGKWSLGQICRHLRLTVEANMNGYPKWMIIAFPLRPILRWFMLGKLLSGKSPTGVKTAGVFIPPANLEDDVEVMMLIDCLELFAKHEGKLFPHPGFGSMSHCDFARFHAAHASHHLSFLVPALGPDE